VTTGWRLGLAIASGVPVLIVLSLGPVAALAGPPSVAIWPLAALVGLVMALSLTELVCRYPDQSGGIGVAAGHVLRPFSPSVAALAQWSYWLGWSLGLGINAFLVGDYLQRLFLPGGSPQGAWLIAVGILGVSVVVNHFGIRPGALFQSALLVFTAATAGLLLVSPLVTGHVELGHLAPFEPPGGWASLDAPVALAGAFFIAGWSAYGAEIVLSYRSEYARDRRDLLRCLRLVAVATVAVYTALPFVALVAVGSGGVRGGPVPLLESLSHQQHLLGSLAPAALLVTLFLTLNTVAVGSSRALMQMARNGEAWSCLGRLNRHGAPGNALVFDLAVNAGVLAAVLVLNGDAREVPIAVLASANVGYFLSLILALVAAWSICHTRRTLVLAVFNTLLLAAAGAAWGWDNIVLGVVLLVTATVLFTPRNSGRRDEIDVPSAHASRSDSRLDYSHVR
jgi:amino acid transporter